eukprot:2568463-Rhodomonas_salina.1
MLFTSVDETTDQLLAWSLDNADASPQWHYTSIITSCLLVMSHKVLEQLRVTVLNRVEHVLKNSLFVLL